MDGKEELMKKMKKFVKENKCLLCNDPAELVLGGMKKKKGKKTSGAIPLCGECADGITEALIKRLMIQEIQKGKIEDFLNIAKEMDNCEDENCPIHGKKGVKIGGKGTRKKDIMYH